LTLAIAARQAVFLRFFELVATVCLLLCATHALAAQEPRENASSKYIIERIDLVGNRRVQTETLMARILSRSGDPYSLEAVQRDVQALRDTQYFDEVRLEVEDSPHLANGKIVVFIVVERPIIDRIEYKGIQSISEQDIRDAFKDKRVGLLERNYFDRAKLTRAVAVISELLAAHGHPSATVEPTYQEIPSTNTVTLVFDIEEGPKTQK
jgi:outer membrane protein insertion porin family